jgi:hypothetical protein
MLRRNPVAHISLKRAKQSVITASFGGMCQAFGPFWDPPPPGVPEWADPPPPRGAQIKKKPGGLEMKREQRNIIHWGERGTLLAHSLQRMVRFLAVEVPDTIQRLAVPKE